MSVYQDPSWCGKRDNDDDSEIKSYEQRCNCKHVASSLPLPTNRREDDNTDHSYSREERGNEEEVENSHDRHSRRPEKLLVHDPLSARPLLSALATLPQRA